jgi:hypothetical protein
MGYLRATPEVAQFVVMLGRNMFRGNWPYC